MAQFKEDEYKFPDEVDEKPTAKAEEKFEVEIEDDTPPEDRGRKPMKEKVDEITDDELSAYDEKVQARFKKFTRGYHDERRAKEEALREREAAEAFARQVLEENKRLQQQLATGSKAYIETAKSAAEAELVAAKERYKKAYEAADSDAIVAAQEEIARATVKIQQTSSMRPVEVDDKKFQNVAPQQPQRPVLSRRTQKWVDENSDWWGVDDEMTSAAMGLDKKLAKEYGPEYVGSEEYFETIDKTMRKRFPEFFAETQSQKEPAEEEPPRRASKPATVVAPASRSTPPSRIRLKASEAAIARRLGVSLEEYAKQVAKLDRN
jgi:hypothetical protein